MTDAAPAPATAPATVPEAVNPGKTMGILGLVFSFFFVLDIVGLILSIIALNKSKKAGMKNGPALAGIIVSIVTIVIGVIILIGSIVAIIAAAGFITEACVGLSGEVVTDGVTTITCP